MFQMMAAAAHVIEIRLGKSPFSDPDTAAVARNAWRQIIHALTANPLEGEIHKESLRVADEILSWRPPAHPSPKPSSGLGAVVLSEDEKLAQHQKEWEQRTHEMLDHFQQVSREFHQKLIEFSGIADEAARIGLSFPKHK
jgi:hypothetical protein